MKAQLPAFERARVLVVGDVMLDRYWHGAAARISPEAPVPVVHVREVEERPGGAGNVAINVAALGATVCLLAVTGDDEASAVLIDSLSTAGVSCRFDRLAGLHTVTKLRVLSRHQQLIRLDFEDDFQGLRGEKLVRDYTRALVEAHVVVFSDYGKGTLGSVRELIDLARTAHKAVLVDPKGADFERYRGASLITPNLNEFEAVTGPCRHQTDLEQRGAALLEGYDIDALLVTRGEQGVSLLQKDQPPLHLPAQAREVYDVTGAGDTVISVLAASLGAGSSLPAATALANTAAGIVVGKLGTAAVTAAELRQALHASNAEAAWLRPTELLARIAESRRRGECIVMTNGCFDILHAGHVAYLEQARALGDRLVVAVNDDASVRRLKGTARPINPLASRMAVLAALRYVDWVVSFSEDTPERLIREVCPEVLVKGGDYRPDQIVGYETVRAAGGQVIVLDYHRGFSTSGIIDRMRTS